MTQADTQPRFVLKGWHVLVAFVLFFAIDIAVNAVFMVSAYRTFPGETSITPYEDGLAYNAELRQQRTQQSLGWRFTADAPAADRVQIEAFDRAGAPIPALRVTGRLRRPATDADQRPLDFHAVRPGVYVADLKPIRGAWDLEFTARDSSGRVAKAERRLYRP